MKVNFDGASVHISGSVSEFAQFLQQAVLETAIHQPLTKIFERINHMETVLANLQAVDSRLAAAVQENISDVKQAADDQGKAIAQLKDQAQKIADLIANQTTGVDSAAVQAEVDALTQKADALEQSNASLKQASADLEANLGSTGTGAGSTGTVDLGSTGNEAGSDGSAPTDANAQHPSNADIGATSLDTGAVTNESIGTQK